MSDLSAEIGGGDVVGLKGILAALAMTTVIILVCLRAPAVAAGEQKVMFTIEDDELGVSASFAVSVDWDSAVSVDEGVVAIVSYDLSPDTGSLSMWVPLSELGWWLPYVDEYLDIPVPTTPIGQVSMSLTQSVTGVPASVASVNLVIQAAVSVSTITCSSGNEDILTQKSTLSWTSWGDKSIYVDPDDASEAVVVTTFQYALSVGVVATILDGLEDFTLVPQTNIATVQGSPTVITAISVEKDLISQYLIPILVVGVIAAVAVAAVILIRKRKGKKTG
jgi:hypothetical protein